MIKRKSENENLWDGLYGQKERCEERDIERGNNKIVEERERKRERESVREREREKVSEREREKKESERERERERAPGGDKERLTFRTSVRIDIRNYKDARERKREKQTRKRKWAKETKKESI